MAEKGSDKEKKVIVDEDWKQQAQREKEELSRKEQQERLRNAADASNAAKQAKLPPADFSGLVSMLATQAFYALGVLKTQEDEEIKADLTIAKYNIDLLGVIEEKTKGNLEEGEKNMLSNTLHQLRMAFVTISSKQGKEKSEGTGEGGVIKEG
jgi:hypothetical protein